MAGLHLEVAAGAFLSKDTDPDIPERAFCGKIKMKYCFGCVSVSGGGGEPLILGGEFGNVGRSPQETTLYQ